MLNRVIKDTRRNMPCERLYPLDCDESDDEEGICYRPVPCANDNHENMESMCDLLLQNLIHIPIVYTCT